MGIVSLNFLQKHRKKFKKLILVGGAFDVIHAGHIRHLKEAKLLGDTLVVQITGDKRVREKKGPGRPFFTEKKRAEIVSAIRFVDYVFINDGRHYDQKILDKIKPDVLFFNQEDYRKWSKEAVRKFKNFKGKIVVSKTKKEDSSSRVITALKNNKKSQSV